MRKRVINNMPSGVYIRTKESRKKMSGAKFKNPTKYWLGKKRPDVSKKNIEIHKGKELSEETKRRISNTLKGENSYLWKGGITPENKKIRVSREYKLWRKACFERDNFTCQATGKKGGDLVVHHINNFSEFPEIRLAIDNGITLSREAHIEFHKIYNKKNNTKEQLEEFINKYK